MLVQIITIIAILFIIALILAPIYYFVKREKYIEEPKQESDE